jgi:hypothetical protein
VCVAAAPPFQVEEPNLVAVSSAQVVDVQKRKTKQPFSFSICRDSPEYAGLTEVQVCWFVVWALRQSAQSHCMIDAVVWECAATIL